MKYLDLFPEELEPGDYLWEKWVESVEPVESPKHCLIVFSDETSREWPLDAPVRIGRPRGYPEDVTVDPGIL